MNILFVDQSSKIGGAQRCFLDLLPALTDRGWTVRAALPGNGPFSARVRAQQIPVIGIRCGSYCSLNKSAMDFVRFPFDLAAQLRTVRGERADLIYVNGPRVLPSACVASIGRAPVFFHAHNRLNHFYEIQLAKASLRLTRSTVVACSEFVAAALPQSVVIPNGTPDMGYRERTFDPCNLRIGMIGSASPQKGLTTFVEVARQFPSQQFIVAGETALVSAPNNPRVQFVGWRDDIASVLSQLDILLIPSKQEGFPRVILEAFSAGVPVIAFPAGGIVEAIRHGETGFVTKDFSKEAMIATIHAAIADTGALQRVAANARNAWEQHYNLRLYRQRLVEMMDQVVSERQPAPGTAPLRQRT